MVVGKIYLSAISALLAKHHTARLSPTELGIQVDDASAVAEYPGNINVWLETGRFPSQKLIVFDSQTGWQRTILCRWLKGVGGIGGCTMR